MQAPHQKKEEEFGELSGIVLKLQRLHTTASTQVQQLAGERDVLQDSHTQKLAELQAR